MEGKLRLLRLRLRLRLRLFLYVYIASLRSSKKCVGLLCRTSAQAEELLSAVALEAGTVRRSFNSVYFTEHGKLGQPNGDIHRNDRIKVGV